MKRLPLWILSTLALAVIAGSVTAADQAAVIHDRKAHFKEIGRAAKAIHEALGASSPDAAAIQASARQIDQLAPQIPGWFPAGSGAEAGVKTGAKPDIWTHPADFKAAAAGFAAEAHVFDAKAASGDVAAMRAEFPALGKACKTCHDQFRQKD